MTWCRCPRQIVSPGTDQGTYVDLMDRWDKQGITQVHPIWFSYHPISNFMLTCRHYSGKAWITGLKWWPAMHSHKFITIELEKTSLLEFQEKLSIMSSFFCINVRQDYYSGTSKLCPYKANWWFSIGSVACNDGQRYIISQMRYYRNNLGVIKRQSGHDLFSIKGDNVGILEIMRS